MVNPLDLLSHGGTVKAIFNVSKTLLALLALAAFVILVNLFFASFDQHRIQQTNSAFAKTTSTPKPASKKPRTNPNPDAAATQANTTMPTATAIDLISLERLHVSEFVPFEYKCDWSALAPDGEQLLCGKEDGLWYGSLTNGLAKRIDDNAYAQWLPNGKQIAYYGGAPPGGTTELYLLDILSGNKTLLSKATSWLHIRVSPRGEILFPEEGDLYLWDPTTETKRLLLSSSSGAKTGIYPGQFSFDIRVMDSNYALSPDGQHLVVQSVLYDEGTLALVDLTSGEAITLTNTVENLPRPFAWSPDGRLAFDVQGKGDIPELWVMNADGSDKHRVLQGTQRGAYTRMTWMPDGQTLLFVDRSLTGEEGVNDEYYAINVNEGKPKKLFANGAGLTISADGHTLFLTRNSVELNQRFIAHLEW